MGEDVNIPFFSFMLKRRLIFALMPSPGILSGLSDLPGQGIRSAFVEIG
jgi:hypothetical protein